MTAPQEKSLKLTKEISISGLSLMMTLSALFMLLPLVTNIQTYLSDDKFILILNHPTFLIAIFDFTVGALLLLYATKVYSIIRARAMLGLGFGVYLGWAIDDFTLAGVFIAAGAGVFMTTMFKGSSSLSAALALGIGGNLYLAYMALNGRFAGFFDSIILNLITN